MACSQAWCAPWAAAYPSPPPLGTRVASLASLTLTPLRLQELGAVDARSNAIAARGTAFLFQTSPWAMLPSDLPEAVVIAALDVAGAPARVRARTRPGGRVLIVGAGHSGILAAIAAAEAGAAEVLVADRDPMHCRRSRHSVLADCGPWRPMPPTPWPSRTPSANQWSCACPASIGRALNRRASWRPGRVATSCFSA